MSYIGNQPVYQAFVTDQFSGNGSTTAFTMSVAPANTASVLVAVSGVLQDPSTYSVSGTTLTFSAAPPSGTGNISARYLGIPASGVTTTAYRTVTEFTATAGQTTFTPPSYTAGYINVYRNGVRLGSADYTATNGTTVVLASGATAGDIVTVESYYVSSVVGAIPATAGAVTTSYLLDGSVTAAKMAASGAWAPTGTVLQVAQYSTTSTVTMSSGAGFATTGFSISLTPRSTSSKVLLMGQCCVYVNGTGGEPHMTIYRGGTNIGGSSGFTDQFNSAGNLVSMHPYIYLDSPATASSVTYTLYGRLDTTGTAYFGANNCTTTLIAMEIAG